MEVSKRRQNRVLAGLFLLSFLIIFISGCDKYTKHKVLTFFFTGVPPLEEEEKIAEVQIVKKIKRKPIPKVAYFVHGPHAAGQCHQCHVISPTFRFRKTGKKKVSGIPRLGGQFPGLLAVPLKDLCIECHVPKHGLARLAHLLGDGPVADGKCTFCHNPHQSPFQYMLLKEY